MKQVQVIILANYAQQAINTIIGPIALSTECLFRIPHIVSKLDKPKSAKISATLSQRANGNDDNIDNGLVGFIKGVTGLS